MVEHDDAQDLKNDDFVRVMVPRELKARIRERARHTKRSLSSWVRLLIEKHFEERDREAAKKEVAR